ncbi:MAG: cytochrome c [Myxococcaceae bacterium]|nr:cytochrome c [Myxococcaceae bacterium]
MRAVNVWLATALVACGGNVGETLVPTPFDVSTLSTPMALQASPSFADERGGGVFLDVSGRPVRVRIDGTAYLLESHPGNPVAPGPASAVWPLGPFSSVVATSKGLFVAESGWLIAPPWREVLPADGLVATAVGDNGVAWLAHSSGLFKLEGGALSELKEEGQSITGINALAIGPGHNGALSVWFARGEKLSYAERTGATAFTIKDSRMLSPDLMGGITALAGLTPSAASPGELWAITQKKLWRFHNAVWAPYELPKAPKELKAAGRILWLRAGDGLFRYDGDAASWGEARGLAAVPTLLATDAAGAAWVRAGEATLAVTDGMTPRVQGLFQNEKVYGTEAPIVALVPLSAQPEGVFFQVDDGLETEVNVMAALPGEGRLANTLYFSMGGREAGGAVRPASFITLPDGQHRITATARYPGGVLAKRAVHFTLQSGAMGTVSFATDIQPIFEARCANCHTEGPGRDLTTYALWQTNAQVIVNAVKDKRMPADGPLDPSFIQKIARWVNGGMLQ